MRIARRRTGRATFALCTLACIAALGCTKEEGGNDDGGGAGTAGVPAAGAGAPAAGTGGAGAPAAGSGGAGAGAGGSGGSGGMLAMPVVCGGTTCMPPAGSPLMSCCLPDDTCGLGVGMECLPAMAEGTLDATCPTHMSPSGSMLMGCCKADNKCGVMSMAGLGCVERTAVAMFAGGPLGGCACGGDGSTCAGGAGAGGAGAGGMGGAGTSGTSGAGAGGMAGAMAGSGGTVSAKCTSYCACMENNCASSSFPMGKTCEEHCATASDTALTCWTNHCNNVPAMGMSHCAHALGDGTICPAM